MADPTTQKKLRLVLVAHDRKLLDIECDEVQVPGSEGALGILPGHTPLISILKVGEVIYLQGRIEHYVALAEGCVEVAGDVVTVLTESAELPEEIDVDAARREASEAEKAVNEAVDEAWIQDQVRLERALSRISVAQRVALREVRPRE